MKRKDQDKTQHFYSVRKANFCDFTSSIQKLYPLAKICRMNSNDVFEWNCDYYSCNDFCISTMSANTGCGVYFKKFTNRFGIILPIHGEFEANILNKPYEFNNKNALFFLRHSLKSISAINGAHKSIVLVWDDKYIFNIISDVMPGFNYANFEISPKIDLSYRSGQMLSEVIRTMASIGRCEVGVSGLHTITLLNEAVVRLLLEQIFPKLHEQFRYRRPEILPSYVKHAVDYMHAHLAQPIRMKDVAGACGVTVRAIEYGFKEFTSSTPMAYLQRLRLEAVHTELSNSKKNVRVIDVARKWGFSNPGRFSSIYCSVYGQYPSFTVRQFNSKK